MGFLGFLIWVIVMVPISILFLVRWHAKNTAYGCPDCGFEFRIGTMRDLITPHNLNKFYLKCPRCSHWHWMSAQIRQPKGGP